MSEKLYYSMGEVAEMFDVNQSLLRHWESQFPILRPKRNKKGATGSLRRRTWSTSSRSTTWSRSAA